MRKTGELKKINYFKQNEIKIHINIIWNIKKNKTLWFVVIEALITSTNLHKIFCQIHFIELTTFQHNALN